MECTARVLREKKVVSSGTGKKLGNVIQVHCPVLGEVTLWGEEAEKACRKIHEKDGRQPFFATEEPRKE